MKYTFFGGGCGTGIFCRSVFVFGRAPGIANLSRSFQNLKKATMAPLPALVIFDSLRQAFGAWERDTIHRGIWGFLNWSAIRTGHDLRLILYFSYKHWDKQDTIHAHYYHGTQLSINKILRCALVRQIENQHLLGG